MTWLSGRGDTGTVLPIFMIGARWGWVVKCTPRPNNPRKKPGDPPNRRLGVQTTARTRMYKWIDLTHDGFRTRDHPAVVSPYTYRAIPAHPLTLKYAEIYLRYRGISLSNFITLKVHPLQSTWQCKIKVMQTLYRSGQVLRVPGDWDSQISRQSAHEDGNIVSPTHRPPLTPREIILLLISFRGCVEPRAIVLQKELCQWRIRMTPSGTEHVTFRLVAQCLNHM
jgi:hypothetical protein